MKKYDYHHKFTKDFPKDFWNKNLNPITGSAAPKQIQKYKSLLDCETTNIQSVITR